MVLPESGNWTEFLRGKKKRAIERVIAYYRWPDSRKGGKVISGNGEGKHTSTAETF